MLYLDGFSLCISIWLVSFGSFPLALCKCYSDAKAIHGSLGSAEGSKAQNQVCALEKESSKNPLCPWCLGYRGSISPGRIMTPNLLIIFHTHIHTHPFFPVRKYIQATAAFPNSWLPTECAQMTLERFQTCRLPPALIPVFPLNRCRRPCEEVCRVWVSCHRQSF